MIKKISRKKILARKKARIRVNMMGTKDRPRMSVYRSLNNIFVQLIDDESGHTLASSSTLEKAVNKDGSLKANVTSAAIVGKSIAERAIEKGIKKIVFDRNGYVYTGLIKALADASRAAGLEF